MVHQGYLIPNQTSRQCKELSIIFRHGLFALTVTLEFEGENGYRVRVIKNNPKGLKEVKEYREFRLGRYYI